MRTMLERMAFTGAFHGWFDELVVHGNGGTGTGNGEPEERLGVGTKMLEARLKPSSRQCSIFTLQLRLKPGV